MLHDYENSDLCSDYHMFMHSLRHIQPRVYHLALLITFCNSYSRVVGIYVSKPTAASGQSPEGKRGLHCHIFLTNVLQILPFASLQSL